MARRIYTDTSVIGGCFDVEYRVGSSALIDAFVVGSEILVISDLTLLELTQAPVAVWEVLDRVPERNRERVELTESAAALAQAYLKAGVVTRRQLVDAQHIAVATLHRVDVLVSWNFKHIVNLTRIHGYNSVNLRHGHPLLEIRTPLEVL
jgi:hypothetical protein